MHFGCSNLMLHIKSPIISRKTKKKVQSCQTVKWQRGFKIVLKLGKCHLFRWIHTLSLFLLQTYSHMASETRSNLSTLHWWMGKNPLESYWGDYFVTFKGAIQLKLVNVTITSKAYQENIKSDIKLKYKLRVNILKRYFKVRYLVECLGYSAFILEFYIAFDIILICLTDDCFINKLKLRDLFKSYEIVRSIRLQWIFIHPSMQFG